MSVSAGANRFGHPRLHFRLTDSTNERARELALSGAPDGALVTATEQAAGRGRRGRVWTTPPGKALLCSLIMRPLGPEHALLPLAVPLAVCEAIEAVSDRRCKVKWPNDIWIEERKVAGILIEGRPPEFAVIGVGVNVAIGEDEFPADLRWPATSLGGGVEVEAVCGSLCERLSQWVEAQTDQVLKGFRQRDALKGREVWWRDVAPKEGDPSGPESADGSGIAGGIDERGNLVVVTGRGERRALGAGEVQLSLS